MTLLYFVAFRFNAFRPQDTDYSFLGGGMCRVANRVTGHLQHVNNSTRFRSVKVTVVTFRIIRDREF